MERQGVLVTSTLVLLATFVANINCQACHFYPLGENRRFERVAENIKVDDEVFKVQVYPRNEFKLEAVDNSLSDINYFKYQDVDEKTVAIRIAKSLEDLVDSHDPQSVLKFKLTCRGGSGTEEAFLPVTVYIQDINDHAPEFQNTPYHLDVDELTPVGLTVFRGIRALDRDKPNTANSDVTYSIVGGNGNNSFVLSDPIDGILVVNKPLDYDHGVREFQLQLQAKDHGSPVLSSVTKMTIRVRDADDQNPLFTSEVYKANVSESLVVSGATIRQKVTTQPKIHAFDQDAGINARLKYNIILGNDKGIFELHEQTGELFLVKELDLEALPSPTIILQIQATQMDNPLRYALARIHVNIQDINDNMPQFEFDTYNITVMENLPPGFTVVQVFAVDADQGDNSKFVYQLDDSTGAFKIDPTGGWISVKDPNKLDRETKDYISMKVRALERRPNVNPNAKSSITTVEIHLLDANDNNPEFQPNSVYTFRVIETDLPGTVIGRLSAIDPDLGDNGRVRYFKQNDTLSQRAPFDISPQDGAVFIMDSFSNMRVKPANYTFFVKATDMAEIPSERRTSVAVVHVNVTDVNNNPPQFLNPPFIAYVGESLPPGAQVYQITAKDPDSDTVLDYSIVAGNDEKLFYMNNVTGMVLTAAVLDYEVRNSYDLLIQASDGVNTAVSPLTVRVVDINDNRPKFSQERYNFSVVEEMKENLTIGTVLAKDRDSGKNSVVRYTLVGDQANEAVLIDERGNIITRRRLDREKEAKLNLIVVAFDSGIPQLSGTASIAINVEDINDNVPVFGADTFEATVPEEKDPPFKVFQLKADDFDAGDNAVVKYAIVGGNEDKLFGVDENSGIVFTTSRLDYEIRKQYILHVAARNIRLFQGPEAASLSNPVVTLVVRVEDINDERVVFERQTYHFRIPENAPRSITVGVLNATNPHRIAKEQDVNFWIGEGNELKKFWMNPKSGELVLMDTVDRDYPANQTSFRMKAYARDNLSINSFNSTVPIIVDIEDVNDNSPVFDEQEYALELPESLPVGTELPAFFRARDIDFGNNGRIDRYYINTTNTAFQVNGTSGALTLLSPLDYEKRNEHVFVVMATDKGNPQRTGTATVKIKVQNINEYSPEFVGLPYQFWVQESAIRNTRVGEVKAFDADGNNVFYSITGDDADFFAIEETTGRLYVKKDLPAKLQYKFVVRATDDGLPQNNSLGVHVAVRVRETNDYAPSFTNSDYKGTVREKEESAKVVVKVAATDLDLQENIISYSISNGNDEGVFTINNATGEIRVTPGMGSKIDYDKKKKYVLVVQARDSHQNPLSGISLVQVDVQDTNDHAPMFQKSVYSASLIENLPAGHCFLKVVADSGDTNDVVKYFTDGNLPFLVDSKSGDVCTKTVLDREQKDKYDFSVLASDGKFETLASISIDVLDENDNPPKFENNRYVVSIPHTSQPGRSIIQIHAADPDSSNNGDVTYWIKNTHGAFEIDAKTGLVRLASTLPDNFSLNKTFEMDVFAQDHGAVSNIAKTMLVVRVSNTENQPPKFNAFVYSVFVDENKSNIGLVTVKASDPDSGKNGKVVYRIARATNREAFRIDPTKGKITLVTPLDYETTKYLELVVEARDEARDTQFSTALVQVTVIDRNDNAPEFLATPSVLRVPQSTSQSEVIYTIHAMDKDSPANGHNDVTYSLVPPSGLFAVNPKTGQIFAVQPLTPVIETLHIVASDGGNPPLSSTMDVAVEVYKDSIDEPTPVFSAPQYHINMDGLIEAGSTILETRATVPNGSPVAYNISDAYGYPVQKFAIDLSSGKITATSKITAAAEPLQHFLVTAYNRIDPRRRTTAGVVVKLKDTNSRCPKFPFTEYYAMVKENTPPDAIVLHNIAVDDPHQFTSLNYQITEDNSNDNFVIDHRTVNVSMRIKNPLDRDAMSQVLQGFYTITVTASNGRCTGSTRVRVYVEDVNDNSPIFEKNDYVVELKENSPVGHVVLHLKATDKDELDNLKLRYFIVLGNDNQQFILEEKTGVLSVNISPDREKTPAFRLQVIAVDSANNTGLANVHVIILDENDWKPTFLNKTFILNVTEGPSSVGASIHLPIVDNDEGVNRQLEVYIADGNSDRQFKLGVDKHGQAILTVSKELDREKYNVPNSPIHVVVVAARDMGSPAKTGSATVAVVIHDINDSPPKFEKEEYYSIVSESVPIGTIIDTVKATDPDTAAKTNLTYGFGRRSGNIPFALDPITGSVNITRQLDISVNQEFTVPIEAFDGLWKNTAILKVFVREAEERDPRFNKLTYKFQVPENVAGAVVGQVELKPRRTRANSQMRYTIVNTDVRNLFNITKDGIIYTKTGLDRENRSAHTFTVMLEEKRPSTRVSVSEVTVEVLDVNDEIPKFMQNFKGNIKENSPSGSAVTVVPAVSAVDNDSGNNSIIRYSLIGPGSEIFSVFDSGVVVYTPREPSLILDRESKETYKLKVVATDRGNLSSTADLTITIEDENDNAPQFQHGPLHVLLPETARPGTRIAEVKAIDRDAPGPNSKIQYNIVGRRTGDIRIDRETGEIFVVATLQPSIWHLLNISAVDGHGLASFTSVNVTVVDINDHRPRFERADYRFSVLEGNYSQGGRYKVGVVHAIDEDTGRNGKIDYATIVTSASDKKFPFSIDVHTGELFATGVVDREKFASFRFKVMALDNGEPPLNSTVEVRIDVEDINDEVPKFFTDPYLAHVPENLDPGHKVTQITAFDPDSGANGQVFYRLGNGHQNKFYIDSKDGTVWTLSTLDYEQQAFYNMTVIAYDHGTPSLSATAKLWVTVADTNDALPDFPKSVYTIELAENTHVGESVYTLDAGEGNFKYLLINTDQVDTFEIERGTGQVRLIKPLDSLQKSHYRLMVKAVDDSDPPRSDTAEVNILIGTGHGVRLFPVRMYEVNVAENQLAPLVILDLNATDETAHRRVAYSIVGSDYNGLFIVEPESGRISVTASLDREKKDKYSLKLRVENLSRKRYGRDLEQAKRNLTDQPLAFDEALVLINVADENDNPPVFENHGKPVVAAVPLEATFGYRVAKVNAADSDIGLNAALRYDIIRKEDDASSKFHIDPVNGVIRSMITFSLDGGHVYSFDVKATDREGSDNGNTAVSNVFVYVLPETRLVLFVAGREPLIIERHIKEIVGFLSTLTGYKVMAAKLEPHHEGDSEDPESTDLFLYAVDEDTNEIVDTEVLLSMFRENSQVIVEKLEAFRILRIQGVSVQEKISQMGATEMAIIALSSVIFLGAVLGITLLCTTCKKRRQRRHQKTWEQQRLYNIKNPLMGKTVGNPYGSRKQNGSVSHISATYANGEVPGSGEYSDSLNDDSSLKKNNKKARHMMAPDGASSINASRASQFERYNKNETNNWYDMRDGVDSIGTGFSKSSAFTSWSSRHSRRKPVTEL